MFNFNSIKKYILSFIIIIAIFITLKDFIDFATMPYDGNLYVTPQSKIYIRENIFSTIPKYNTNNQSRLDLGNILLSINNIKTKKVEDIYDEISKCDASDTLDLIYLNVDNLQNEKIKILKSDIPENSFKYLKSLAIIIYIDKGGVADKSGMKIGDLIVRVDGKEFDNDVALSKISLSKISGETINYEILRKNEYLNIKLELVRFGIKFVNIYSLLIALILIFTGAFFIFKNIENNYSVLVGISLLCFSQTFIDINTVGIELAFNVYYKFLKTIYSLLTNHISTLLILFTLIHFPKENKLSTVTKKIFIFFVILKLISLMISIYLKVSDITFTYYNLSGLLSDIIIIVSILVMFVISKIKNQQLFGSESKILLFTFIIYILLFLFDSIANIFRFQEYSFGLSFWGVVIIPISYWISIFKYKPYDISVKIKRNIQYYSLLYLWRIIAIILTILFLYIISIPDFFIPNLHFSGSYIEVLGSPLSDKNYKIYSKILVLIFFTVFFIILRKINKSLKTYLDLRFNKVKIDYKSSSEEFNVLFNSNSNIEILSKEALSKLTQYLQVQQSSLILFNNNSILAQHYIGINDNILRQYVISLSEKLIENFINVKVPIKTTDLTNELKYIFEQCKVKLIIPIRNENSLFGIVALGDKKSEEKYNIDELKYIESFTNQISIVIDKIILNLKMEDSKRIQQELEFARKIQLNSLPQKQPKIENLDISAISIPALEVGGDFFDYLYNEKSENEEKEITLVIGDVSGKGTSAALYMSKVQGIIRTLFQFNLSPRDILIKTNELISQNINKGSFITSSIVRINILNGNCNYSRAGHIPLYLFRFNSQTIEKLTPKGLVLGMNYNNLFQDNLEEYKFTLNENDVLLLISDGIIEARNKNNEEFEEENLMKVFKSKAYLNSENIRNEIISSIQTFSQNVNQFDDLTVLVVKYKSN